MTALTAAKKYEEKDGLLLAFPVVASDVIYQGALVKINAAGYLAPCAAEAGAVFAGVAYETVDNSAGSAGDLKCKVQREGVFPLAGSGFDQASVGKKVYASDDQTVSLTQGANEQEIGEVVEYVSATKVQVQLRAKVLTK